MKCFKTPEVQSPVAIASSVQFVLGLDVDGDSIALDGPNPIGEATLYYDPVNNFVYWKPVSSSVVPPATSGNGLLVSTGSGYTLHTDPGLVNLDSSGNVVEIPPGQNGQVLSFVGGQPAWAANAVTPTKTLDGITGTGIIDTVSYAIKYLWMTDGVGFFLLKNIPLLTAVLGNSGAGGLDTGTEGNQWYYIYAISDGLTNHNLIYSASSNNPVMPTGYTFYSRIGVVFNDYTHNLVGFAQSGNHVDVNAQQSIFLTGKTVPYGTTYVSIPQDSQPLPNQVPPIAKTINYYAKFQSSSNTTPQEVWLSSFLNQGAGVGGVGGMVVHLSTSTLSSDTTINVRGATINASNPQLYWCEVGGVASFITSQGLFVVGYTIEN